MFRNSLCRKILVTLGAFLFALVSFTGEAGDARPGAPDKDPLLPFIDPDSQVSMGQFRELIGAMSPDRRRRLWNALEGKELENDVTPEELEKQLRWVSSSLKEYYLSGGSDYHETVKRVAVKVGIPQAECETGTTFQLERRVMEKMFADKWEKLTPEERDAILKKAGLESSKTAALSALGAHAFLAGAASALSTPSLILVLGSFAVIGGRWLGQPNLKKTAAFIIELHTIKVEAGARPGNGKSGADLI